MAKRSQAVNGSLDESVTPEQRHRMIAEAAYYRALSRGFSGGNAEDDWVQAEREINGALLQSSSSSRRKPQQVAARTRATASEQKNA
jgi:Protein of unknown function (DUF2934)